jgi:hypothetical protein
MLLHVGLSEVFWAKAVHYANIITNAEPTKTVEGMTPYETLLGNKPSLARFKVFGCHALALIQGKNLSKFTPRTREMIYLGPDQDNSGFKLWNPAM